MCGVQSGEHSRYAAFPNDATIASAGQNQDLRRCAGGNHIASKRDCRCRRIVLAGERSNGRPVEAQRPAAIAVLPDDKLPQTVPPRSPNAAFLSRFQTSLLQAFAAEVRQIERSSNRSLRLTQRRGFGPLVSPPLIADTSIPLGSARSDKELPKPMQPIFPPGRPPPGELLGFRDLFATHLFGEVIAIACAIAVVRRCCRQIVGRDGLA